MPVSDRSGRLSTRFSLTAAGRRYELFRLDALQPRYDVARLPYVLRILLENALRAGDEEGVEAVATWAPSAEPTVEVAFRPARVLLQDFTGVPALVDLGAMRDAVRELGGDPARINPQLPATLVVDHSVRVDEHGSPRAARRNVELELGRNRERYAFLRWGRTAFANFKVVPPNTGIVHQVNLEYLARVVEVQPVDGRLRAFPDTVVGADSHTTMVNGLGVLGWGVGGIEAEAAMLGEPISMLLPQVVGVRLTGKLAEGATATDLVLTVTELLRRIGVVGRFVEFFGPGLARLPVADRATIANMAPEYGATCGFFPVDEGTIGYLRLTGRSKERVELVEAYCKENMLWRDPEREPTYSRVIELDLGDVEPSLAGPRRPQDRVPLREAKRSFLGSLPSFGRPARLPAEAAVLAERTRVAVEFGGESFELDHGAVVIAAITSCTNTSNPQLMIGAGLLAKKAVERGLRRRPWVKSSLAPGSKVVTDYYDQAGLTPYLEEVGFHVVGYGCTTCIGNSGPLPEPVSRAIAEGGLVVCSVLSGNRNFEARIHPEVKANYLASPPLVVAYALVGRIDVDLESEPLGQDPGGKDVHLRDVWPTSEEIQSIVASAIREEMFRRRYAGVFTGDAAWRALPASEGELFAWDPDSTYVRRPPYFEGMAREPGAVEDIDGARCLVLLGDGVTTDHISPAGVIERDSPAGRYLAERGVELRDFNSYGSRRGNHEVMIRGTFGNVRLRNLLVPSRDGGWTLRLPDGDETSIYEASQRYLAEEIPLIVIAGKEYGSGSSRDWAAKGPRLLGVRAVLAESFERIHRSNLLMMGILPLEFRAGEGQEALGLTGRERFSIRGLANGEAWEVTVTATPDDGGPPVRFKARVRLDTSREREWFRHGGILPYLLRKLA